MMLRKLAAAPILLAMLMVAMATVIPHHHHETMICIVHEVCGMDGCRDDEHTQHSDANHNEDESHCVAHEQYCHSENIHIDNQDFGEDLTDLSPILCILAEMLTGNSDGSREAFSSGDPTRRIIEPALTCVSPNAPPFRS
jgi:hypothetical protein